MPLPVVLRTDAELNMGASWPSESSRSFRITTAEDDKKETLIRLVPQARILFTCYAPITAEVIAAGKQLQGIVKYGVGVDSIDLEAAAKCGVPVVHCPDYGTGTVSDHAFALLISVARKITLIDQGMRTQDWLWPEPKYRGVDLAGKTLGIVGFGRIGRAVAHRGEGFGMRRLVCDPYVPHDTEGWRNLEFAPLDQVIEQSDFLSLHCVLTPETKGLLDADVLGRMKRSAVVVNVSRGELIDQAALVDSLRRGALAGAGLDVFSDEPLDRDHPLRGLPNVILTPHVAFYTLEAYERLESECLRAVKDLLAGELPKNVKNAEALRRHGFPLAPTADISSVEPVAGSRVASPTREEGWQHWLLTEGDTNLSPLRERWQEDCLDAETRQLLERDGRAFLHQSLSTPCLTSLANCDGIYLIDEQGRRYMDFHGNSAHQVGYRHPRVIEAIKQQLDVLPFCPRRFTNRPAIELAEKLVALAPDPLGKVLLAPGGTTAIGIAMKLARYATGRHKTISMWDSFHGASLDAISIGGETLFREGLGPLLPGCFHVPWPYSESDADRIEQLFLEQGDIGAVIAEPIRCTTVDRPPDAYWRRVRQLCDLHGALLVFDEIPLALGRTGRMFCMEHVGVVPDVLVIGKGLGGGVMPMAAVIVREDLDVATDRALGHYTHEKSPVGAAAALATIDVIESEGLLQRAEDLGRHALSQLQALPFPHSLEAKARGIGLALAVELHLQGRPAIEQSQQILYGCLSNGLSFKVSDGNVLTLTPPLTISHDEMDHALQVLEQAIARVSVTEDKS